MAREPLLRAQGPCRQRDLGRRPRALGPAREAARRARPQPDRRRRARRAPLLRDRPATGSRRSARLRGREAAASTRPGRGRGGPASEPRDGRRDARARRRRLLPRLRLLDVARPRLCAAPRRGAASLRLQVDRGVPAARRLLGICRAPPPRAAGPARDHGRARGRAARLPAPRRHGLLRHRAARRRLVRRPDGASPHRRLRGGARHPRRAARVERLQLPLRCDTPLDAVRRVPDDVA